jgi:DNA (cytosine-5)-methyltransferase 1
MIPLPIDMQKKKLGSVLSLFTGAMGLDLGLEAAGFDVVVCAEADPRCGETIRKNKPKLKMATDVREMTERHVGNAGLDLSDLALVAGGPPCQSWSTMGKRLGFDDPRGLLVMEFGRVVREFRPRFFVMENVKGLATMASPDGRLALDVILEEFADIGYKTVHGVLDAVDHGAPQFRERLFVIGSRDGEDVFLPEPSHFRRHQDPGMRWRTLRAIERVLTDPGPCLEFSPKRKALLERIPPGGNWKSLDEAGRREVMGKASFEGGGNTGYFRRLSWDEPCPTLVTSPVQKSTILCHPDETRPLSAAEYALVQQFPTWWEFSGELADVYRQVGNAVPGCLGRAVGLALRATMEGGHTVESARLREGIKGKRKPREEDELVDAGRALFELDDD